MDQGWGDYIERNGTRNPPVILPRLQDGRHRKQTLQEPRYDKISQKKAVPQNEREQHPRSRSFRRIL